MLGSIESDEVIFHISQTWSYVVRKQSRCAIPTNIFSVAVFLHEFFTKAASLTQFLLICCKNCRKKVGIRLYFAEKQEKSDSIMMFPRIFVFHGTFNSRSEHIS